MGFWELMSIYSSHQSQKVDTIHSPTVEMRKSRQKGLQEFGHVAQWEVVEPKFQPSLPGIRAFSATWPQGF